MAGTLDVNASLPRPAIFGIRLYERYFYLSPVNPAYSMKTLVNSCGVVATALCRRARRVHTAGTPRHSEATTTP